MIPKSKLKYVKKMFLEVSFPLVFLSFPIDSFIHF